jgi:hypothetical protein
VLQGIPGAPLGLEMPLSAEKALPPPAVSSRAAEQHRRRCWTQKLGRQEVALDSEQRKRCTEAVQCARKHAHNITACSQQHQWHQCLRVLAAHTEQTASVRPLTHPSAHAPNITALAWFMMWIPFTGRWCVPRCLRPLTWRVLRLPASMGRCSSSSGHSRLMLCVK